ncbi:hypothetical protein POM88_042065 [Heracleum sosnowskyi]|uniref:DUF3444 domain-containing protein n=1 Tax=Heracleum sosnowskyi TaxID=360622 RepID=A0AAD8HG23_9APIA|nr:hypothetical protein POM88_042065 [Heracleum sosnowskyi]
MVGEASSERRVLNGDDLHSGGEPPFQMPSENSRSSKGFISGPQGDDKTVKNPSGNSADDAQSEVPFLSMNVPDPDFHDFDEDRTEMSFEDNQVWAAYDDGDCMPQLYAFVQKLPNYVLTGQEGQNAPKGCQELDPAAIPLELLQVINEVEVPALETLEHVNKEILLNASRISVI